MSSHEVFNRLLDPVAKCLTAESARHLIDLRADAAAQDHVDELAAASTAGTLTPEQRAEYEAYVAGGSFIAILQSKARAIVAANGGH